MSETVTLSGTFKEVDLEGKTLETWARGQFPKDTHKPDYFTWFEWLEEEKEEEYFPWNERLFQITEKEDRSYDSFADIAKNEDGSYSFLTSFYNGGTYLAEMLVEGMAELHADSL